MAHEDPQVWVLLYDQLPPAIRWVVICLTLGMAALARWWVKNYEKRLNDLEQAKFMTREEHAKQQEMLERKIDEGFRSTHQRIDKWVKP